MMSILRDVCHSTNVPDSTQNKLAGLEINIGGTYYCNTCEPCNYKARVNSSVTLASRRVLCGILHPQLGKCDK